MTTSPDTLADAVQADGNLPPAWASSLRSVDRARFIPDRAWLDTEAGVVPIDRGTDPDGWAEAVYSDRVLLTQFDDGSTTWPRIGHRPTSSSSMPSSMLGMLDALDAQRGHRVLEIGAGTGYNAALIAAQIGPAGQVVTVEVDPALAGRAHRRLAGRALVVTGDGGDGYAETAPYDRVIATATAQLGKLPYAWVQQCRPGAVIIAPVRTDLTSGPLVRYRVDENGTALGKVAPQRVGFMELRTHRCPLPDLDDLRWDDPCAEQAITAMSPVDPIHDEGARWTVGVRVPSCRWRFWKRGEHGLKHGVVWFVDPVTGSWTTVAPGNSSGANIVRQFGPRRLWDEVESAYRWWQEHGCPALERWRFEVTATEQRILLEGADPIPNTICPWE
ncbi:protein-L-isoaspartate O-methyltransferase [Longimycelium tulufanense]|uniref:Protein-L-isoaspartate O-methyltransferase n=1 Tax=Longimycelium tulufanense TaxID=907463 RepID=A0A8J3C750_9PSEU|nr:methyltransferase domain-containing protein [Longimycelium tulufanense]GGM46517.1 protein-L-isoaspartate O-methyltransferase [Longimycelium tulufanense]